MMLAYWICYWFSCQNNRIFLIIVLFIRYCLKKRNTFVVPKYHVKHIYSLEINVNIFEKKMPNKC